MLLRSYILSLFVLILCSSNLLAEGVSTEQAVKNFNVYADGIKVRFENDHECESKQFLVLNTNAHYDAIRSIIMSSFLSKIPISFSYETCNAENTEAVEICYGFCTSNEDYWD